MFANDARRHELIRQRVGKAEKALLTATHLLTLGKLCPADTACYHAQQCVEKYLKALLVNYEIDFPSTHSIAILVEMIPQSVWPEMSREEQLLLTDYATVTRYPGDYDPPQLVEARRAVTLARRLRAQCRKHRPKSVLA